MVQIENSKQSATDKEKVPRHQILEDFTIIIPTVGRPIFQKCLQSIVNGKVLPARIIVVDQGDNPAVVEWVHEIKVKGLEVHHFPSTERSPASARNLGIKQVQTTFLAAIDDDCIAESSWLEKMSDFLYQEPKSIVTGRVEQAGEGVPPTIVTFTNPHKYSRPPIRNLSPLATGNVGCALSIAKAVGSFDINLFTAEDNDWAYRALKLDIPIHYRPEVIVHHYHWRNKSKLRETYQEYARGQGAFYGKHLRRGDWSMLVRVALSFFRGGRGLLHGFISNDRDQRMRGYVRVVWLFSGLVGGLRG